MSTEPMRSRARRRGTAFAAGVAALAVLMSGCGGTRQSDEAIEKAAGVGQAAPITSAGTDTSGVVPGTTDTTAGAATGAVAPGSTGATTATGTGAATAGAGVTAPGAQTGATKGNTPATTTNSATGANKPAAAGATAAGPATKSLIRVGAVGTFSGPVGALVKDTVTGIRVWAQWTNAHGGVNGHPVEVLVGDDGGDPARYSSIQQQFVEQKGAIAFLYGTLGFSPNGNNKYLDSKKIFTFGTEGGLDTAYTNPYVLTATPTGHTNADSILYALGDVARPLNKHKFAEFACSDFGLCDNFDQRWSNADALKAVGFQLVARGRPSLTQPDYTSQCLAAKQGGAEIVMLALDTASLRRFAGDCARQNYKPIFGTADLLALSSLPSDPNADGMIIASKMAPWTDLSVPGIAQVTQAFAQYAPGAPPTGGNTNGWILGQFFAAAGASLPDNPTPADVATGLYKVKNNNLQGMTFPITMTPGKPMPKQLCYGVVVIQGGKYAKFPGKALRCTEALPGSGSVETSSVQPAMTPEVSSGMPSARFGMSVPSRATVPSRPADEAPACAPARAAGWSYFLDAFQTGSAAGPGVFYGIALAVLGTPLPDPFAQYQNQFIGQGGTFVEQMAKDGPAAFQQMRNYFEPFAVYNDYANTFIETGAKSFDSFADQFGSFLQPGDTSMHQFAASMRDAEVNAQAPCDVKPASVGDKVLDQLAAAFVRGDTKTATALIRKNNLGTAHDAMIKAILAAGIATSQSNNYQPFIDSVSQSFVDGGISPMDAGQIFGKAAAQIAPTVTFEQGAIGFRTICQTYALYLQKGKFA